MVKEKVRTYDCELCDEDCSRIAHMPQYYPRDILLCSDCFNRLYDKDEGKFVENFCVEILLNEKRK